MDQHVYVDILSRYLIPYANEKLPDDWIFQANNDPKHTSRKAKQFLEQHHINVMQWPAKSPDLNPIEHLWNYVKNEIEVKKPSNLNDLYNVIEETWKKIPIDRCIHLINSMPRRCSEVIKNKGGATRY
ncbi:Transposable element Tcb1 transposase [Anthophora quadrimaculata]